MSTAGRLENETKANSRHCHPKPSRSSVIPAQAGINTSAVWTTTPRSCRAMPTRSVAFVPPSAKPASKNCSRRPSTPPSRPRPFAQPSSSGSSLIRPCKKRHRARKDDRASGRQPLAGDRAGQGRASRQAGGPHSETDLRQGRSGIRKASGYAHAKQFLRLRRTVKRQRTILGIVLREVRRKLTTVSSDCATAITRLNALLERAERIRTQQTHDKNRTSSTPCMPPKSSASAKVKPASATSSASRPASSSPTRVGWWSAPAASPAILTTDTFSRPNWSRPTSCLKTLANHPGSSSSIWDTAG